ncbi:mycofactocin-coupled SDR family oxidoreductase [Nocardia alni]|uniref:mycofactocin-coupled SDR family oxidoreductase n=1 Tax=Nocardia alni TaxID=2815723 RepID=UPI001C21B8A8|nr:mycofactocin-coupled SDR family oxidoreductase [Nocardia alni]
MGRVQDKVVLITGAARGQGRAHALRLAEEGADIIAVDICADIGSVGYALARTEDLDETADGVKKFGRRVVTATADVRDPAALRAAVAAGVAELGHLDAVIAQAGIAPLGSTQGAQAFLDAVTVDFNGVVHAVDAALPHLPDGGAIIATGSLAALAPATTDNPALGPGGLGYSFAKRTVASFVHDLATVLAPRRIRVNAIHPTNCNTAMLNSEPMYRAFRPDLDAPTREDALATFPAMTAMGNPYVEPEDVAEAALFLISDAARHITGMQMRVDSGGYLIKRPQLPTF